MNEQIKELINNYSSGIINLYNSLRKLVFESVSSIPQETMWAKLPSCPGSGKSTFSRTLHKLTGIPLFHLDMMNWNSDRTIVDKISF